MKDNRGNRRESILVPVEKNSEFYLLNFGLEKLHSYVEVEIYDDEYKKMKTYTIDAETSKFPYKFKTDGKSCYSKLIVDKEDLGCLLLTNYDCVGDYSPAPEPEPVSKTNTYSHLYNFRKKPLTEKEYESHLNSIFDIDNKIPESEDIFNIDKKTPKSEDIYDFTNKLNSKSIAINTKNISSEITKDLFNNFSNNLKTNNLESIVNHPSHYNDTSIETMEMFLLFFHNQPDMIKGALLFNIFKYRDRAGKKNSPGDIEKMNWYLDKFELLFPEDFELYDIYHSSK